MKSVLISGHAGFVGGHFLKLLDDERHEVTGVDVAGGIPNRSYKRGTGPMRMDARDFFRNNLTRYDLVIHLAAVVGGRKTIEGSPLKVAVDLAIDAEMFQWALRTKPGRVVYFSSSAAYPTQLQTNWPGWTGHGDRLREQDIDLDDVRQPDQTYGWAKLTGEMQARLVEEEGVRVHVFRPFSGYGESQSLDYPWPSFIKRAREKQVPFEVWGDGGQVRDWIHIDDVVAGAMACVEADVPGPVNLCTGIPTSFNDLAEMCMAAAGHHAPIEHHLDAPQGVRYRVGDPSRLHEVYRPKVGLTEVIGRALA